MSTNISKERVEAIAKLARLELDDDKAALFAEQFDSILGYMDTLNELDTTGVEPLFSPVMHETVFRNDEAKKHVTRDEILSNAPEDDGQFFVVPRIV